MEKELIDTPELDRAEIDRIKEKIMSKSADWIKRWGHMEQQWLFDTICHESRLSPSSEIVKQAFYEIQQEMRDTFWKPSIERDRAWQEAERERLQEELHKEKPKLSFFARIKKAF